MASLVDTNILVYRYDPRNPSKQVVARDLLRNGLASQRLVIPHQAILEFVAATTRPRADLGGAPLLTIGDALREAEGLMRDFPVVYPDEQVLVTAMRGVSTYDLSWFDAHLWAFAEANALPEILSEDFEHGRHYGGVRTVDPFLVAADEVHELPAMYDSAGR
ncbi:MAG: PIN domain-containing protein [Acidobacteriota bacterium]